jgi:hypothetical protein
VSVARPSRTSAVVRRCLTIDIFDRHPQRKGSRLTLGAGARPLVGEARRPGQRGGARPTFELRHGVPSANKGRLRSAGRSCSEVLRSLGSGSARPLRATSTDLTQSAPRSHIPYLQCCCREARTHVRALSARIRPSPDGRSESARSISSGHLTRSGRLPRCG